MTHSSCSYITPVLSGLMSLVSVCVCVCVCARARACVVFMKGRDRQTERDHELCSTVYEFRERNSPGGGLYCVRFLFFLQK